jgi:hypothetical protein
VDSSFLAALHQDANSSEIADLADAFHADNIHVAGRVEEYDHFGADNSSDADGSANLKAGVGLDEFHGAGADLAVSEIEIGLLFAGIVLGDGEIGIGADAEDGAVIERDASAGEMAGVDHVAPENLLRGGGRHLLGAADYVDDRHDGRDFSGALRHLRRNANGNCEKQTN